MSYLTLYTVRTVPGYSVDSAWLMPTMTPEHTLRSPSRSWQSSHCGRARCSRGEPPRRWAAHTLHGEDGRGPACAAPRCGARPSGWSGRRPRAGR
eukprot:5784277-Prymnesium_polylepis.2